jgi:hypothetical protein
MPTTHPAETLSIFNAPADGDVIRLRDGSEWLLKQSGVTWGLYKPGQPKWWSVPHPSITGVQSMQGLISSCLRA